MEPVAPKVPRAGAMNRGALCLCRRLSTDQRGAALLLFTIMLPVIMGLIALSVDAGQYMMTNTELQDIADAAALAGAKELDGKLGTGAGDSAVERAKAAALAILQDTRWAEFSDDVQILPAVVSEYVDGPDLDPTNSDIAHFVTIVTLTKTYTGSFIRAVSSTPSGSTRATATAGSTVIACKVPPLMICAPGGDISNLPNTLDVGRLYRLKGGGGDKSPAPGSYGLLDTPGRNTTGTNELRDNLGRPDPNVCFLSQMSRRNGVATTVDDAINTRFDMYPNSASSILRTFPPAPVTTKGKYLSKPKQCTWDPLTGAEPLSRGATETPDVVMGAGSLSNLWPNKAAYWAANHQAKQGTMPNSIKTRYDMYLWELADASHMPSGVENAYPNQCWTDAAPTDPNRRVIYAAVLDCSGSQVEMKLSTVYLKFFITEPASGGTIYAEFVGKEELGGKSGVLHHVVQLYR